MPENDEQIRTWQDEAVSVQAFASRRWQDKPEEGTTGRGVLAILLIEKVAHKMGVFKKLSILLHQSWLFLAVLGWDSFQF